MTATEITDRQEFVCKELAGELVPSGVAGFFGKILVEINVEDGLIIDFEATLKRRHKWRSPKKSG